MSRSWLLYLDELIESGEKIVRLVAPLTFDTFSADETIYDAVLFNLQVIGEAVKKFPEEARASIPPEAVSGPARLRDLIAHHYFSLDAGIIWDVATRHVPTLLEHARAIRARLDASESDSTAH